MFPALQTRNSLGTGVVVAALPATAKLDFTAAAGAVVESEHAAKKAIPNPAPAKSATCLFICMCVSISSLVVIPRLLRWRKTRLSVASHDRDMEREYLALPFAWFPNTGVVQHRAAHNEKCLTKTQVTHSNQFAVTAQTCELRCRGRDGGHKAFRWTAGDCKRFNCQVSRRFRLWYG